MTCDRLIGFSVYSIQLYIIKIDNVTCDRLIGFSGYSIQLYIIKIDSDLWLVNGFLCVLYTTVYDKDWQWLVTGQYVSLVYYIVPQHNWSAWYSLILMKVTSNTHSYNYFLSSFYYLYWPRVTFYKFSRLDEIGHVIYDGLLTVMLCLLQRP